MWNIICHYEQVTNKFKDFRIKIYAVSKNIRNRYVSNIKDQVWYKIVDKRFN